MNRLLVWEHECDGAGRVRLEGHRAAHVRGVLGAQPGDTLRAGIVDGPPAVATVLTVADTHCDLWLRPDPDAELPAPPNVDLLLAMPRPKFLKRLLPQLATLGVRRLFLISAQRVERFYFDTHVLQPAHYLPLLLEGLAQATDTRLPQVRVVRPHKRFLRDELVPQFAASHLLLAHPGPRTAPDGIPADAAPLLLAIGPEGGWADDEVAGFEALGFRHFSLGDRILRTDMACVAVLGVLDYLRGAFRRQV